MEKGGNTVGSQFVKLFDKWAETYDHDVYGDDEQYREVFAGYDAILEKVAERAAGTVLEFGVGTGNLTEKLMQRGHRVYGVEPSPGMRDIAKAKLPDLTLLEGDFLQYPAIDDVIHSIVSTYAFHHLTDDEKSIAIGQFYERLADGGKVVFADTAFLSEDERQAIMRDAALRGLDNLLHDLRTEYYPLVDTLRKMFTDHHFKVKFSRLNRFVWLMEAIKV